MIDVGLLDIANDDPISSAPVELFVDRVGRAAPRVTLNDHDIRVVADICRLLDGLPLALELAAARCSVSTDYANACSTD